jgi:hypothetical protein
MGLREHAWKYVLVVGLCAVAGYFALPGPAAKDVAYSALGIGSMVCILIGIHIHKPRDRLS